MKVSIKLFIYTTLLKCQKKTYKGMYDDATHTLTYSGERFEEICVEDLLIHPKTVTLIITRTNIKELPQGINQLKYLKNLVFTNNLFVTDFSRLENLIHIKGLTLESNNIKQLPTCLAKLTALQSLNISDNCLTEFPKDICNLTALTALVCTNNKIQELPDEIANLYRLRELYLSQNNLSKLNIEITKLQNLKILAINNNAFYKIPLAVCVLAKLEHLNLINTGIADFSYSFLEIANFKSAILQQNIKIDFNLYKRSVVRLKNVFRICYRDVFSMFFFSKEECLQLLMFKLNTIEKGIANLTNLTFLFLSHNYITAIPDEIINLKYLFLLSLSDNSIDTFPTEIIKMKNLAYLGLANNEISTLPTNFNEFVGYKYLNVSENYIKPSEISKYTERIKFLYRFQYATPITIAEVLLNMKEQKGMWNIHKLNSIRIPFNIINQARSISDYHMKRMWEEILKYLVYDNKQGTLYGTPDGLKNTINGNPAFDKQIADLSPNEIDEIISLVADSATLQNIELFLETSTESLSLAKTLTNSIFHNNIPFIQYDLDLAFDNLNLNKIDGNENNNMLNAYTKIVFLTLIKQLYIAGDNRDEVESVRTIVTALWKHSLKKCITGKLEGLMYYYTKLCSPISCALNESIADIIEKKLAYIKEECFITLLARNSEQNVHFVNKWRVIMENIIGINTNFKDPYKINEDDVSDLKKGSVLQSFFDVFHINKVVRILLDYINSDYKLVNMSFEYFKNIKDQEIKKYYADKTDNNNVFNDDILYYAYKEITLAYFEYEEVDGFDELEHKKLKVCGLFRILFSMNVLICNRPPY